MASRAIKVLANLMRVRKENAESPYVLILGAGASLTSGASSFGKVIENVVADYSVKDLSAMSWDGKVAEFYDILDGFSESERYAIIKKHIEGQRPSAGYHALAQLAKEGYFGVIFSTNYDTFVEDAFADAGLRSRDYTVLINGQDTEEGIIKALGYPQPRIKLVKLHGDLGARIFAFTPEEIFQFGGKIEQVLTDYLSRDVIISGHGMRDDDINRCLRGKGGSLWYVNPSAPTASDFIWRAMRVREGRTIESEDGYFDNFFCALRDELVGAPPAEAAVSSAAPAVTTLAPSVPMNEIFISYSRRDSSFVDRLIREFEQKGLDIWMDREDIGGGAAWRAAISQAIRECEVFIVVLSPQSVASRNVTKELSLADKHNKPIIPIRYQPCEIPPEVEYQLAGLQWVDFTEQSFEEALDQLIRALRLEKGEARRPQPPQPESPRPADMAPPALPQLLPGTWQVQIGYQHTGVIGQITLEMQPNGSFRGQVLSQTGISSIEGQWQITLSNQLVLQGRQTAGFQVAPYTAMIQFTQIAPDLLMGVSGTGEQIVWQRINQAQDW